MGNRMPRCEHEAGGTSSGFSHAPFMMTMERVNESWGMGRIGGCNEIARLLKIIKKSICCQIHSFSPNSRLISDLAAHFQAKVLLPHQSPGSCQIVSPHQRGEDTNCGEASAHKHRSMEATDKGLLKGAYLSGRECTLLTD